MRTTDHPILSTWLAEVTDHELSREIVTRLIDDEWRVVDCIAGQLLLASPRNPDLHQTPVPEDVWPPRTYHSLTFLKLTMHKGRLSSQFVAADQAPWIPPVGYRSISLSVLLNFLGLYERKTTP